jgi:DNA topoisomerase I
LRATARSVGSARVAEVLSLGAASSPRSHGGRGARGAAWSPPWPDSLIAFRPSNVQEKKARNKEGQEMKWTTLEHAGVLFPPEYEPHGVKMLYEGRPVDLTPEQEEVRPGPWLSRFMA